MTTGTIESLAWIDTLANDQGIKTKLNEIVKTFDDLVSAKKITDENRKDFLKKWLWDDHSEINEKNNWLVDKYIQKSINSGRHNNTATNLIRSGIITSLWTLKCALEKSGKAQDLTDLTWDLTESVTWDLKKNSKTPPAQPTPASATQSAPTQQEVKPKTENQAPPVPVAEPVKAPAPVQAPVLVKTPPVPPAPEKPKSADKPAVVRVIEPSDIKQRSASAQKPAPVEVQTTTPNPEIPSTNVKLGWVKKELEWHFKDTQNPTKDEVKKVLTEFQNVIFNKNSDTPKESARGIFAIQACLNLLWIQVGVDWIFWNKTRDAIKQFQENYNKNNTQKKIGTQWFPGPKTVTALLDQLK